MDITNSLFQTLPSNKGKVKQVMEQPINIEENKVKKDSISNQSTSIVFRLFQWHGKFCASQPWEVIFLTLTLVVCSLSLTYLHQKKNTFEELPSLRSNLSDIVILTIARCVAFVHTYIQFSRLRRLGCRYLFAIASVFTIIFSFGFSLAVITFSDAAFKQLNEALPFFFLFMDLPKACTLAKFALSSDARAEVVSNIGQGMALLGPSLLLDSVTMGLVVGVGMMSGIGILSSISCFSCLSIFANYLAFVSFYPACLAIMIELMRDNRQIFQVYQLAKAWKDGVHNKPNLALQKVKLIMCAVLVFFHLHALFKGLHNSSPLSSSKQLEIPSSHFQHDHYGYIKDYKVDSVVTALLAGCLVIKYFFFDSANSDVALDGKKGKGILKFIKTVSFMEEYGGVMKETPPSSSASSPSSSAPFKTHPEDETALCPFAFSDKPPNSLSAKVGAGQVVKDVSSKRTAGSAFEHFFNLPEKLPDKEDRPTSKFTIGSDDDDDDEDDDDGDDNGSVSSCVKDSLNDKVFNQSSQRSKIMRDGCVQTDNTNGVSTYEPIKSSRCVSRDDDEGPMRSIDECMELLKEVDGPSRLTDGEVMALVACKKLPAYRLETALDDFERGVCIRRKIINKQLTHKNSLNNIPYSNYDYKYVHGACCENVIGYLPIPVGVAGPLLVDGIRYFVPMATTEGCLVASANRGCRALVAGGGVKSRLLQDGMTRAPLVRFKSAIRASEAKGWMEENFKVISDAFNSTSRFARLKSLRINQNSRSLYIRFIASTGDAMGMNMLSKGSEKALQLMQHEHFPDMQILSLSSNFCTDKKPNAVNWIDGRGKSVVCEAVVPGKVVREVLKTTVKALVDLNIHKNLVGSALAGSVGGFNAHAANLVTAIFIATGQDPAQNVCSSNCMTSMEVYDEEEEEDDEKPNEKAIGSGVDGSDGSKHDNKKQEEEEGGGRGRGGGRGGGSASKRGKKETSLYISCNMPCLEVGTVGGGTILPPQAACLEMMGVKGAHKEKPGENAGRLARVVCSMVMAGELSLMSSLTSGDLVKSHLKHNRSTINMAEPLQCIPI